MTISSCDQGGVCVINRQGEENLIKKIDFKQEFLDSLEDTHPLQMHEEVNVNISRLLDENPSQNSTMNGMESSDLSSKKLSFIQFGIKRED